MGRPRKDAGGLENLPKPPIETAGMKTQDRSGAGRVRAILHEMPKQFTVIDVRQRLPDLPIGSSSAALRWCRDNGFCRVVGRVSYSEYKAQGKVGAPPIIYEYIGNGNPRPIKRKKHKHKKPKLEDYLAGTELALQPPTLVQAPNQEVVEIEQPAPPDKSPEILKTLTNALLVVQIAGAIQDLPPEQALQVVGSLKHLAGPLGRRR
jgi:hypothetical protein